MAATPEIKTKFSLEGLSQSRGAFRRLSDAGRQSMDRVKEAATRVLAPFDKDVKQATRSLRALGTVGAFTGRTGFTGLMKSSKLAFVGIAAGAAGASSAILGVGYAARRAATESAKELDKIAKQAKALGITTEDLSILGYAAEQEGVDPDQAVKGIARIGRQFVEVREKIAAANAEFDRLLARSREDASFSLRRGSMDGVTAAAEAVAGGRSGSLAAIQQRAAYIEAQLEQVAMWGFNRPARSQADHMAQEAWVTRYRRELEDLKSAEAEVVRGLGPAGQALFGLERYGLDVEATTKGGVAGFLALGDAMRQVEDPAERLRYSVQLFGEEAGEKLLNLLMAGREGMAQYRKEAIELGIVVDKAAADMAEAYETSVTRFAKSRTGLKMEAGRAFLPGLTEANVTMTRFIVTNRKRIVDMTQEGLAAIGNFARDAWDIAGGKTSGFRTQWVEDLAGQVQRARRIWSAFRADISAVMERRPAQNNWIDAIGKGLWTAVDLSKDLFRVLTGGNAQNFPWLNDLRDKAKAIYQEARDWLLWFTAKLKEAWDMFSATLAFIRDKFLKPIADLFGTDPTSMALFLAFAKFSGLLGVAVTSIGLITKGIAAWAIPALLMKNMTTIAGILSALTGVNVGGALGTAAAGVGAKGVAGAAGAGIVARGLGLAGGLASGAAIVGTGALVGAGIGQYAYDNSEHKEVWDSLRDHTLTRMRQRDDIYMQDRTRMLVREDRNFRTGYWGAHGIDVSWASMSPEERDIQRFLEGVKLAGFSSDPRDKRLEAEQRWGKSLVDQFFDSAGNYGKIVFSGPDGKDRAFIGTREDASAMASYGARMARSGY